MDAPLKSEILHCGTSWGILFHALLGDCRLISSVLRGSVGSKREGSNLQKRPGVMKRIHSSFRDHVITLHDDSRKDMGEGCWGVDAQGQVPRVGRVASGTGAVDAQCGSALPRSLRHSQVKGGAKHSQSPEPLGRTSSCIRWCREHVILSGSHDSVWREAQ